MIMLATLVVILMNLVYEIIIIKVRIASVLLILVVTFIMLGVSEEITCGGDCVHMVMMVIVSSKVITISKRIYKKICIMISMMFQMMIS